MGRPILGHWGRCCQTQACGHDSFGQIRLGHVARPAYLGGEDPQESSRAQVGEGVDQQIHDIPVVLAQPYDDSVDRFRGLFDQIGVYRLHDSLPEVLVDVLVPTEFFHNHALHKSEMMDARRVVGPILAHRLSPSPFVGYVREESLMRCAHHGTPGRIVPLARSAVPH